MMMVLSIVKHVTINVKLVQMLLLVPAVVVSENYQPTVSAQLDIMKIVLVHVHNVTLDVLNVQENQHLVLYVLVIELQLLVVVAQTELMMMANPLLVLLVTTDVQLVMFTDVLGVLETEFYQAMDVFVKPIEDTMTLVKPTVQNVHTNVPLVLQQPIVLLVPKTVLTNHFVNVPQDITISKMMQFVIHVVQNVQLVLTPTKTVVNVQA
jgi:hypothetical protein